MEGSQGKKQDTSTLILSPPLISIPTPIRVIVERVIGIGDVSSCLLMNLGTDQINDRHLVLNRLSIMMHIMRFNLKWRGPQVVFHNHPKIEGFKSRGGGGE